MSLKFISFLEAKNLSVQWLWFTMKNMIIELEESSMGGHLRANGE